MEKRDKDQPDLESPLGLADEPIVKTEKDHLEPSASPSAKRRRARALGEDGLDHRSSGLGDLNIDANGASGVDMGYGGEGTDIKPKP
jgi:hypothetical protein